MELEARLQEIRVVFDEKDKARERALVLAREITRCSARAIRLIHDKKREAAEALFTSARKVNGEAKQVLKNHQDLYFAGYIRDAQKEFVEAMVFSAILSGAEIPGPADLEVEEPAYLNGLGEAVGELRRHMLDCLREDNLETAQRMFEWMERIFSGLAEFTHHDAITGGLRVTVDRLRGIMEKSRDDLTMSIFQQRLLEKMQKSTLPRI